MNALLVKMGINLLIFQIQLQLFFENSPAHIVRQTFKNDLRNSLARFKMMRSRHYSYLSNKRVGPNQRVGWKIGQYQIIV